MSIPTSSQINLLRTPNHSTRLWLSIYQPRTILACRVNNASAAKGDRVVTYDGVTAGTYVHVKSGMTAYIGTSLGSDDKGTIRVRSATSSTITFAENKHINWADNDYITIVNFFEIHPIYQRLIQDPDDETSIIIYKDYDIAYTNQNDVLGSFICMGSNYAGFRDSSTGTVYYSASGTLNLLGSSNSYHWFFEGGTPTGSNSHTPGNIYYTIPGHYVTRLIVSGSSSGQVDTSYRHISIYDRPANGTNVPILNWELNSFNGSRDDGGWEATITIRQSAAESIIRDGAMIVIYSDDYYGSTKQSIGGNELNRSSIVFAGWIIEGSIKYNWKYNTVSFTVGSTNKKMETSWGQSTYVKSSTSPSTEVTTNEDIPSAWGLVKDLNVRRALYQYLKWHSTVLMTTDFEFVGTDKYIKYFDSEAGNIYEILSSFMENTLRGTLVCDRHNKLFAEVGIDAINNATGTVPVNISLSKVDYIDEIEIDERQINDVLYLEAGGFSYSGSAAIDVSTPLLACAPGDVLDYEGGMDRIQGLAIDTQSELNILVGNLYAFRNARYPTVFVRAAGNYRNIDIAPQEQILLTTTISDNNRGLVWNQKSFFVTSMSWQYNPRDESFLPEIELHEVTQGFAGDTIDIPEEAPDDDDGSGDDGIIIPPLPPLPPIIIPPVLTDAHPATAYMIGWKYIGGGDGLSDVTPANYRQIIAKSTNFNTASPTWTDFLSSAVGMPPSGTFIQYLPMASNPAQGGYWMTNYGIWWISGLNLSDPASVVSVNILTAGDAKTTIGESANILFRCMTQDRTTAQMLYVGMNSDEISGESYLLRSARALGNTWTPFTIATNKTFNGNSLTLEAQCQMITGYMNPLKLHTLLNNENAGLGGFVFRSLDAGATWSQVYDAPAGLAEYDPYIYMPEYASYNDEVIYLVGCSVTPKYVYRANNDFTAVTDITPSYGGSNYGAADNSSYRETIIEAHKYYPTYLKGLFYVDGGGVDSATHLFSSPDSGANWTHIKEFTGYSSIHPRCQALVVHPNNVNYLYLVGNRTEGHILVSSDAGATYTDKIGDWYTKFATYPTRGAELTDDGYAQNSGMILPQF